MGNMLPCLVQQGTTALPAMNPKQRLVSLKLLVKALHKMKKRPGNNGKANIDGKPSSSSLSSSSSTAAAADGSEGGGELELKSKANSNPKSAVLRSRLHGGRGGHKKGVVRVKVVLTKEEAARLLSLTVGGQKTAAQIVAEIKKMEARRANAAASSWRPALESIPELGVIGTKSAPCIKVCTPLR
ncbi:uncharacterized protein LOC133909747 [Phragmites australis]|uniref:uncharacterized protein LOC133909747 n=1 Tax=Phragmites australis TaxID=29695 RepID=UPI002D7974D4|nr:uncharacterized protein LOC133909747 [Phragmites australis]